MLKSYLSIALRNLWKNKGFSAINIAGLAAGLATCLLILLYVLDELNFDRYNIQADRIYRIDNQMKFGDNEFDLTQASPLMGPTFVRDFPQVIQYVRFRNQGGFLVKKGTEFFKEERVIYADSTLFDVFTLPMIAGNPKTALTAPRSLVITESMAMKYFNSTDVVGQFMVINDNISYTVTGVIKDVPAQSHFQYDFFIAMTEMARSREDTWLSQNFNTYFLLKPGTDVKQLEKQFNEAIERYAEPELKSAINLTTAEFKRGGGYIRCRLMPLTDIHLYSNKPGELSANGNIQYVYIFSAIAIFILLIACVNFMNLSTARAANRAKEVGVRKVLGSDRKDLIIQFLTESLLISFFAFLIGLLLIWILIPFFNELSQKDISLGMLFRPDLLGYIVLLLLTAGLLAGSYPAFFLSAFKPVAVLKGKLSSGFKGSWLRNSLVVFQFAISIMLIAGTGIIYNQLTYIRNKDIGFNKEQLLIIQNTQVLKDQSHTFRNELLKLPGVQNATVTSFLPVNGNRSNDVFFNDLSLDIKRSVSMQKWSVDEYYIPTLQIQLVQGRNFSPHLASDSNAFIINEAAARQFGQGELLNKTIYQIDDLKTKAVLPYRIIGIMKDFNYNSLHEQVTPLALRLKSGSGSIAVLVSSQHITTLLGQIKDQWKRTVPAQPFSYSFMDEDFNNQYLAEQRIGRISITFSILAILIACLGLFGLVTYATEQRVKEIGIRKVLGANVSSIIGLLSKDLLKLVALAIVIASPVAYWVMSEWLQHFAYRTIIGWQVFAIAGLAGLLFALVTIGYQTIRAALRNPVRSLRIE